MESSTICLFLNPLVASFACIGDYLSSSEQNRKPPLCSLHVSPELTAISTGFEPGDYVMLISSFHDIVMLPSSPVEGWLGQKPDCSDFMTENKTRKQLYTVFSKVRQLQQDDRLRLEDRQFRYKVGFYFVF